MALLVIQTINTHIHSPAIWSISGAEWWLGFKVGQGPDWRTHTNTYTRPHWVIFTLIFILCGFFKNSRLILWNEQFCESITCPSRFPSTISFVCLCLPPSLFILLQVWQSDFGYVWPLGGCGRTEDDGFITQHRALQTIKCTIDNFLKYPIKPRLTEWWCISNNTRKCWCNWKHVWWHYDSVWLCERDECSDCADTTRKGFFNTAEWFSVWSSCVLLQCFISVVRL